MPLVSADHAPLRSHYPWIQTPLIVSAPMRLISGPALALAVSHAGGIGFLGAGAGSDLSTLPALLAETSSLFSSSPIPNTPDGILPVGVGFLNWGADLSFAVQELKKLPLKPAAVWFFAPNSIQELVMWTTEIKVATGSKTKIWIQVGTAASALEVARACHPDVLVVQGCDAGGHGLVQSSSIVCLVPEVADALVSAGFLPKSLPVMAAGGISDGRGVAAALVLGASGVCMGTRFLATPEADISTGYKKAVLEADDGGMNTVRTTLYDSLRGTQGWPKGYDARGIINKSYRDYEDGRSHEENVTLYGEATKLGNAGWGKEEGRMTTYAGTGVGLVKDIKPAAEIIGEVLAEVKTILSSQSRT